jgi:hypothetical protein
MRRGRIAREDEPPKLGVDESFIEDYFGEQSY